jgi:hypothetical protein
LVVSVGGPASTGVASVTARNRYGGCAVVDLRRRRIRIAAAGYAVAAIFAIGTGVVRALGAPLGSALVVGALAAAPLAIAFVGERITGVKAFGFEISLKAVEVPIAGDDTDVARHFSQAVMEGVTEEHTDDSMVGSEAGGLSNSFTLLIEKGSKLLRINLRDNEYWWSTRIFLVAAIAEDYTDVEALAFVQSGDAQTFVGIASPREVREQLAARFATDGYEGAYRNAHAEAVPQAGDRTSEVDGILQAWPNKVAEHGGGRSEYEVTEVVGSNDLRRWLRGVLDTQSVSYGPLTALSPASRQRRLPSRHPRVEVIQSRHATALKAVGERDPVA